MKKTEKNNDKKLKYFVSGFVFIANALEKNSKKYKFTYKWAPIGRLEIINNIKLIKKMVKSKEMEQYDIVHLGNWETNLFYKKTRKDQIYVAHAHGFYVGVNFNRTIVELPFVKRQLSRVLKLFYDKKMKKQLRSADIFYVSTPNMLEPAKKEIRGDAIWLPNPIDTAVFKAGGEKKKLEGSPSVFLPTRIHAFKNPLFAAHLFRKIKAKYPKAKLHIINYGQGADPLYNEFMRIVFNKEDVISHDRMSKEELVKYYRGADLVLGQFNELLGNLSLVELEAMATGAPIVTLDNYETNMPLEKCEELAFKIIKDKKFRSNYIKRNLEFIKNVHSEKKVAELHNKYLTEALKKKRLQN